MLPFKTKRLLVFLVAILVMSMSFTSLLNFAAEAKRTTASTSSSSVQATQTGTVSASTLNVRSSYSSTAKIIGTLSYGQTVYIIKSYQGWYQIVYGSGTGWVSATYITNVKPISSSTASTTSTSSSATSSSAASSSSASSNTSSVTSSDTSSTSSASSTSSTSSNISSSPSSSSSSSTTSSSTSSSSSSTTSSTSSTPTPTMPTSQLPSKVVSGYYTAWSAYSGFTPDKVNLSKVNVLHYAFAAVGPNLEIAVGDSSIDYTNFSKLNAIKANYPGLKTIISVGGWDDSSRFSDMALNDSTRKAFAASCVRFIKQYGFDGVDIDWEYPVSGGAFGRPEDKQNFTLVMQALRSALNSQALADGKYYYLTFAGGASTSYLNNIEVTKVASYVDYALDMTYDLHGPWDKYSDFNAALYTPTETSPQYKISDDSSIKAWLSAGFPKDKLVLGIPFYGYMYTGVSSANNGLYSIFTSAKAIGYDSIAANYLSNSAYAKLYSSSAQVPYLYGNGTFISYDDAASIAKKSLYAYNMGLRGVGAWELSYDRSSVLLTAAYNNIR